MDTAFAVVRHITATTCSQLEAEVNDVVGKILASQRSQPDGGETFWERVDDGIVGCEHVYVGAQKNDDDDDGREHDDEQGHDDDDILKHVG